jgi:hypothetical protein
LKTTIKSVERIRLFEIFVFLIFVIGGLIVIGSAHQPTANFVVYRFASNLLAGRSLDYWTPIGSIITYPLVPVLLLFAPPSAIPTVASLITVIAIAISAVLLSRLLNYEWLAGVAYLVLAAIQPMIEPGYDDPRLAGVSLPRVINIQSSPVVLIMIALVLAALDSAKLGAWRRARVLIGLAILTEPTAVIPALLLFVIAIREENWQRYLIPAALIPTGILAAISLSLGGAPIISILPGIVTLALPIMAGVILLSQHTIATLQASPYVAILAIWSAILLVGGLISGSLPTGAIVPGLIAMIVGLRGPHPLPNPPRQMVIMWPWILRSALLLVAVAIDFILGIVLVTGPRSVSPHSKAIGEWIAANTPPTSTVATSDIGALAFYANRPVLDLSGQISPQPTALDADFFLGFAPDVIVLREGTEVPWPNFATTYTQVYEQGDQVVYRPIVNFAPLDNHGVDVNYSVGTERTDLRLTNVAIGNALHPGDLVRIRLDWELGYTPNPTQLIEIKLNLVNEQAGQPIAGILDKLPPERWRAGKISTYHAILLPSDLPADASKLALYLGVTIRGAVNGDLRVAEVSVVR